MKILYVEDDLSMNIPRITSLFSKYLDKKTVKKLNAFEADESGYGGAPEEIKRIVEASNIIEVEYRFPEALKKIIQNHKKYALFIIDRNLDKGEYEFDEVKQIDPTFNKEKYKKYSEWEGDYLLLKLAVKYHVDVLTKFYFLTGYPAQDEVRGNENIQGIIDVDTFNSKNFIGKGESGRLKEIIDNIKVINLRNDNKIYLDSLRNNIADKAAERFFDVLVKKNSEKETDIIANLGFLRNILEKLLTKIAKLPEVPKAFKRRNKETKEEESVFIFDKSGKLKVRPFINWLNTSNKIEFNSLLRNFVYNIQGIGSDFGPHDDSIKGKKPSGYQATANTVNALVYAMKDIILWFDKVCRQYKA